MLQFLLTQIGKLKAAVSGLSSNKVTVKQYSVTTETNANVSPFGAFAQLAISSDDRSAYGYIYTAIPHNSSTNPATVSITGGEGGILVYSTAAATFNVSVGFIKTRAK